LRLTRGVSIRQITASADISPSTVSRWESGTTQPSTHELNALLDALEASQQERQRAWELLNAPRSLRHLRESTQSGAYSRLPAMPVAGELLKSLRLRRGWTLQQTACHLQISPATLSRWERSETWPSTEQLHHLCYALHARAEELIALEQGRQLQGYDQKPFPCALLALKELMKDLEQGTQQVEPALCDLFYLSLEAHLWRMVHHGKPAQDLLITAYVRHARTLLNEARLVEAQTPAYRALHLMNQCKSLDYRWLSAIHIIAKGAAETGSRFRPLQGVEVLRDWLSVAVRLSLPYEMWFLRDIAEYLSQTRSRTEAVHTSEYAMQRGLGIGEDRNVLLSHALVLLNVGRAPEALELLTSTPLVQWDEEQVLQQKVHESLLWARVLHAAGQGGEAIPWLQRAHQLVEEHNLWQVRARLDTLSQHLATSSGR